MATRRLGLCGGATVVCPAAVAELVDAQASGACVLRDVEVRLLSAASGILPFGVRVEVENARLESRASDIRAAIV